MHARASLPEMVVIALLRGVNVGGNHILPMAEWKKLCESMGLVNVRTLIQSGNAVFGTSDRKLALLATQMEDAIEKAFGFRTPVILRTGAELEAVVGRNPFAKRKEMDPAKLLVTFLAGQPDKAARDRVLAVAQPFPEKVIVDGREMFIYFPNGAGRSKLPIPKLEKALGTAGTARNWNTVMRLRDLAAAT